MVCNKHCEWCPLDLPDGTPMRLRQDAEEIFRKLVFGFRTYNKEIAAHVGDIVFRRVCSFDNKALKVGFA